MKVIKSVKWWKFFGKEVDESKYRWWYLNRRKSDPQHPYIFSEEKCISNSLAVTFIKGGLSTRGRQEKEENVALCVCVRVPVFKI